MNALLAKDLRLSLDTLLPWGLIVAGFGAIAAALTRLPDAMAPDVLSRLTMEEVFLYTGIVVRATTVAVSAWVAAVVAQGDRIHGAEHLMAALPVAGGRRVASKLAAVLLGVAVPAIVATGCFVASRLVDRVELHGNVRWLSLGDFWWPLAATGSAALVGAALGLGVSPIVRGPFRVVAIAMLLGAFGGLLGVFASRLSFDRAAAGFMEFVGLQQRGLSESFDLSLWGPRRSTSVIAAIVGVVVIATVALAVGCLALARTRRPRRVLAMLGAGLALSAVAGSAATFMWFDSDASIRSTNEWARWRARQFDENELVEWLNDANRRSLAGVQWPGEPIDRAVLGEIENRLRPLDPATRSGHPLMKALVSVQDNSTLQRALWTTSLLPFGAESVERSIDAARRYPEHRAWFLQRAVLHGSPVVGRDALWGSQQTTPPEEWNAKFDEVARHTLRALQVTSPAHREAIQALLDEMASPGGS